MALETIAIWNVVGLVAGWLAGVIMRGGGFGFFGNIIVGILGAIIAGYLLPLVGIGIGTGLVGAIIHALIGAIVLLFIIGLIRR